MRHRQLPCVNQSFYNSAITKLLVCARIVVEMVSRLAKMVPAQLHNSSKIHCVISREPFLFWVRTLSSARVAGLLDAAPTLSVKLAERQSR